MAITLGKDVSVSIGGNIASARSVTFQGSTRTIDIEAFGEAYNQVYTTGYDYSVSVEFLDSSDLGAVRGYLESGAVFTVSGGAGNWNFPAVITGVGESTSIDGVAVFTIEAKLGRLML